MKKTSRSLPSKWRIPPLILIVAVGAGAIILLLLKNSEFDNKKTTPRENTPQVQATSTTTLTTSQPPAPSTPETPPLPPAPPEPQPHKGETALTNASCQEISASLRALLIHLEQQPYVQAYIQGQSAQTELNRILTKLLNTPPINSNETADLLSVIRNSSHLYRVLGRKDLSFLKDIIANEHSAFEQHLATLHAWSTVDKACRDASALEIELPLAKTYEYAAFFLNTLGGQSYLSRRDATVRTLAKYYGVLIVAQAAKQSLDTYNLNLGYHLDSAINDLAHGDFLENQNLYLDRLNKIKKNLLISTRKQ